MFLRALACAVSVALSGHAIRAEDLTRQWYFGGSLGFHTTQDEIGSNAAMSLDPRPDDFTNREIVVEDTFRFDFTAGFGLSRWFSLQLDVGYFNGDVGPIEGYLTQTYLTSVNPLDPTNLNQIVTREEVVPVLAGQITEIPVTLSGVARFRMDKPLNPYVGAGAGVVFTEVEASGDLVALNERMNRMRITGVVDENQVQITPTEFQHLRGGGNVPFTFPMTLDVEDAHVLQGMAGVEYFFGGRFSFTAELRYTLADSSIRIEMAGQDQVELLIFPEPMFRPDGSLKIFGSGGDPPNPVKDPLHPEMGRVICTPGTQGDFDGDGHATDLCWDQRRFGFPFKHEGTFVVQGGEIDLSGYSVHVGMRFHF